MIIIVSFPLRDPRAQIILVPEPFALLFLGVAPRELWDPLDCDGPMSRGDHREDFPQRR